MTRDRNELTVIWDTSNIPAVSFHDPAKVIMRQVCATHNITMKDLLGTSRKRDYAWPRQEAMVLVKAKLGLSYAATGRRFKRDHTTVLHAERAVEQRRLEAGLSG